MTGHPRSHVIGLGMLLGLAMLLPGLLGQGCPAVGPQVIEPVYPGQGIPGGGSGLTPPALTFTYPLVDVAGTVGQSITVEWTVTGNLNAAITLLLDPDRTYGNGNEIVVLPLVLASDPINGTSYTIDTSSLRAATYRIIARVADGVNPEQLVAAPGRLLLYGAGLLPGNVSPTIVMTEPRRNLGVSQGNTVDIRFCGRDIDDDGKDPSTPPQILIILDLDNDPTNDIDLLGTNTRQIVQSICDPGVFPVEIKPTPTSPPSAYVLSCTTDADCGKQTPRVDANGNPVLDQNGNQIIDTNPDQFYQLTIDVGTIPPREDGLPYYVRGLMWDRVNRPVNSYAPGTISITAAGSGLIDLASVGRTISGARFLGFDAGGRTGSASSDLGDVDGDGVEDFAIVSQYGRGFENDRVGYAHIVLGLAERGKFASEIPLNSVGTQYRGSMLTMESTSGTMGVASVTRLGDVTNDGKPDILFGMPYVEAFNDDHDDDPEDDDECCFSDLRPNPHSSSADAECADVPRVDAIGASDHREGFFLEDDIIFYCTNDDDLGRQTPLDGGYAILVGSDTDLDSGVRYFGQFGQCNGYLPGVRFRGGWYGLNLHDYTQTRQPNMVDPYTFFGTTVSSMPPINDTSLLVSPRYGSTMLISAPGMFLDRGMVILEPRPGATWLDYVTDNADSVPFYASCGPCCRTIVFPGGETYIVGAAEGDQLGYAKAAGDYNLDGSRDIAMGAPGASRDGFRRNGIVYFLFGRNDWPHTGDLLTLDLRVANPPRMEIHGTRDDDQFGTMQTIVGDINQDGLPDVGFSSGFADGPGGVDSGYIGIVFGGRRLSGENFYTVDQVATAQLPGVKIYGIQPNGHAGAVINNAGDFNGDSIDDMLIVAPDELRTVNGTQRRGVTYLILGGPHMSGNKTFTVSQVGTADLPGIVFVSPYAVGSAEEAPIDWASAAGDVNGDGFDDILLGVSQADYVNPLEPSQRRNDSGEMYLIYGSNTGGNTIGQ